MNPGIGGARVSEQGGEKLAKDCLSVLGIENKEQRVEL